MHLGGTIGRLKSTMGWVEFGKWIEYFNKYGRCGPVRMFDAGAALIAWKVDHIMGGKTTVSDYIPKYEQVNTEASVQDVVKELGGMFK